MNILRRELRANMKPLIIWSIAMIFLIYVGMVKYSGFVEAGDDINKMFDAMPSFVKATFGIGILDLTKATGYYAIFYIYFMLLSGIHAVMMGAIILSKEEKDKTADFLYTKPVKRYRVITFKMIAVLINIIIFNLVTLFSSIFFVDIFNKGEPFVEKIISLMGTMFILQLFFASMGLVIASVVKNIKRATSISTLVLLTMFVINIGIDISDKIDFLKYFSPFKYFKAVDVMQEKSHDVIFFIISGISIVLFIIFTYLFSRKRDIHV